MNTSFDIYEMVTNLITEHLEAGVVPWQMPWKAETGFPQNMVHKKAYRGFNFWFLLTVGDKFGSPFFLNFNQVKELDGHVLKGEKGFPVSAGSPAKVQPDTEFQKELPQKSPIRHLRAGDILGIGRDFVAMGTTTLALNGNLGLTLIDPQDLSRVWSQSDLGKYVPNSGRRFFSMAILDLDHNGKQDIFRD